MSIFKMLGRKMLNNYWIVGSLLLGLIISIALVSSIPTYSTGVLQNLLTRELEQYQIENNEFPGTISEFISVGRFSETPFEEINKLETFHHVTIPNYLELPVLEKSIILTSQRLSLSIYEKDNEKNATYRKPYVITSLSNLEEHINVTSGRMPSKEPVDGVYETLVTSKALLNLETVLDTVFKIRRSVKDDTEYILVKPVGVFEPKDPQDVYWFESLHLYNETFIMNEDLFMGKLQSMEDPVLAHVRYNTAYDYHQITEKDITRLLRIENWIDSQNRAIFKGENSYSQVNFPMQFQLRSYITQEKQLKTLLWSLNLPILTMLGLYIFMVSRLIVDRQKTEIAILGSRGAGKKTILLIYFLEVFLLSIVALAVGPHLGLTLSKVLGASNGFLEFVQRTALPMSISSDTLKFAAWTALACIIMVMIPVYLATRENIVSHKQQSARDLKTPLWKKAFLDFILLGICWYGYIVFQRRKEELTNVNTDLTNIMVDPLLFLVPAIFVIGVGLFSLRLYPLLVKLVYWVGKKYWSPTMYASLIQVGRSSKQYQFFMLFMIMTIAIGIFSAGVARTINNNIEEQIFYDVGADVTLEVQWENNYIMPFGEPEKEKQIIDDFTKLEDLEHDEEDIVQYIEPAFAPYQELPGVTQAAKVFRKDNVILGGNNQSYRGATLFGIESNKFGETAWFNSNLLPHHINDYLNLLAYDPAAVLISRSLSEAMGLSQGDPIEISWDGTDRVTFVVYGIIDYWPSWNPLQGDATRLPVLVVGNLPKIQTEIHLEPYHVWLQLEDGTSSQELYDAIEEQQLPVRKIRNTNQEIIKANNSPFLLGINGGLTLGFLIAIMITFIGFLLYWVLTLNGRLLQYGVFRAMGLSFRQLIGLLTAEQILTSGMACLIGIIVGGFTAKIFVPLFAFTFSGGNDVPPFKVFFDSTDEIRLYMFISFMLLFGLGILSWILSKTKIHQAVKMGED